MRLTPSNDLPSTAPQLALSRRAAFLVAICALAACGGGYGKPGNPESQLAFGVDMARRGLWNEAHFRFEQAAGMDPSNPRIVNNLAVASEALGDFEQAQKHYQDALRLDPGNAELKRNYARFIEFYQNYQSERAGGAEGAEGEGSESEPGESEPEEGEPGEGEPAQAEPAQAEPETEEPPPGTTLSEASRPGGAQSAAGDG